jgi:hypothetical protein
MPAARPTTEGDRMTQMQPLIAVDPARLDAVDAKLAALAGMVETLVAAQQREWLPVREYAAREGVHVRTITRRIDKGELQAKGSGRGRMVKV